jgi:hypothetical protein
MKSYAQNMIELQKSPFGVTILGFVKGELCL